MADIKNFLVVVNSGLDHPYNHYASYVVAFLAKKLANIETVSIYYGPEGVAATKKGALAKLKIENSVKEQIASQIDDLNAADLPDNLEQLARFEKTGLGIQIYSCGTFHVIDGIGKDLDDLSNTEDFVVPLKLPEAARALLSADKIHYL